MFQSGQGQLHTEYYNGNDIHEEENEKRSLEIGNIEAREIHWRSSWVKECKLYPLEHLILKTFIRHPCNFVLLILDPFVDDSCFLQNSNQFVEPSNSLTPKL